MMRHTVDACPASPSLVVGVPSFHLRSVVRLLHRAGSACDFLATDPRLRPTGPVRRVLRRGVDVEEDWMIAALRWRDRHGGRVVLGGDHLLRAVRDSSLEPAEQASLVAVTGPEHLGHVGSKVGLALALDRAGVLQPLFQVARDADALPEAVAEVGYPVMVKVDRSGGGEGVFLCRSATDVGDLVARRPRGPLLVQAWVDGDVVDLSGFFGGGRPVHVVHAVFLATTAGPFSCSKLRRYTHPSVFGSALFDSVAECSQALGLDGFANVTAMRRASDGAILFIEADLRPNVWVEMSRHMRDDPAPAIRSWFERGEAPSGPRPPAGPTTLDIGHLFRLAPREAWANRHGAWRQFPDHDPRQVLRFLAGSRVKGWARALARRLRGGTPFP